MALSADDGATGAAASAEGLAEASEADRLEGAAASVEEAEGRVGEVGRCSVPLLDRNTYDATITS